MTDVTFQTFKVTAIVTTGTNTQNRAPKISKANDTSPPMPNTSANKSRFGVSGQLRQPITSRTASMTDHAKCLNFATLNVSHHVE